MKRTKLFKLPMRTMVASVVGAACGLTAFSASAGIDGSAHDLQVFLGQQADANFQICLPCHTPHDANGNTDPILTGTPVADAPLWNHSLSTASYSMYSTAGSGTLDGIEDGSPSGASALCLSCHDGTVGVDQYNGLSLPNEVFLPDTNVFYVGTDLRGQHPISITYNDTDDPGLAPQSTSVTIGGWTDGTVTFPERTGTIGSLMLQNGKVQCSSCHDVHNTLVAETNSMLKLAVSNSTLCLKCHAK